MPQAFSKNFYVRLPGPHCTQFLLVARVPWKLFAGRSARGAASSIYVPECAILKARRRRREGSIGARTRGRSPDASEQHVNLDATQVAD